MFLYELPNDLPVIDRAALVVHLDAYEELDLVDEPQLVSSPP